MTEDRTPDSRRRVPRIPLASVSLPMLATRDVDRLGFQFFLQDAGSGGLKIAIPEWVTAWNKIQTGDEISFFLPMTVEGRILNQGTIAWSKWDDANREQNAGVKIADPVPHARIAFRVPIRMPFRLSSDGFVVWDGDSADRDFKTMIADLLKDAGLLKKGMVIYLDHLMPYFSRISGDREDYPELREFLLEEVRDRIEANSRTLKALSAQVAGAPDPISGLAEFLDLEKLRRVMEPEIYQGLFQIAFEKQTILAYLREIKGLEDRLYLHYNALVIAQVIALEAKGA